MKRRWLPFLAVVVLVACFVRSADGQCVGDCDGDQSVTVDEVLLGVGIALESAEFDLCDVLDLDGSDSIRVHEIVASVDSLLDDCGRRPTPTPVPGGICGDGSAGGGEECDDGNQTDGDGCSASCELEPGGDVCAGVATRPGTQLRTVRVASGLDLPLYVTAPPLDPNRIFIVGQRGAIRIVKSGVLLDRPFLNLRESVSCCQERGLLSVAFHPDYESNGRFFVNYTNRAGNTVIARYQVSGDPDVADAASGQILRTIEQPFPNHNGGLVLFGPDRHLYIGMGDGGSGGDPNEAGQSDETLLGKLLRMDVNVETAPFYTVPPTNPNPSAGDPLGLIWAKGLRNPWRFSFDRLTGDLYVGDVGQNRIEEIDVQPAGQGGQNYGWDIFEGTDCFEPQPLFPECPNPPDGYVVPVVEYDHDAGCSVTGGFVYRGCTMPELRGRYFYADYCTSFVRSFVYRDGVATEPRDLTNDLAPGSGLSLGNISSFGEDVRGELYICDLGGNVYKIVPAT